MAMDESSKRFICRLSVDELKRIINNKSSAYTNEEMAFVREELGRRGYKIDVESTPTYKIGESTSRNQFWFQPFQETSSTKVNKALSRFYLLSIQQKAGLFIVAVVLIFLVITLLKYSYAEMAGEKDVVDNNTSEQYHLSKINGKWVMNGSYISFYQDDVKKEEGIYVDGRKEKTWLSYYENGKPYIKTEFKNGLKNGRYEEFFEDGTLKIAGFYINDKKEQVWKQFFQNQNVHVINIYSKDVSNGKYQSFFEDKNLETDGYLQNGTPVGEWIIRNDQGIIIQKVLYSIDGNIQSQIKYWGNGLLSYKAQYDSTGCLLDEDYYDNSGKSMISKFVGAWKDKGTDFHSIDEIIRSSDEIRIDVNKKYEESEYSYFEESQMAAEGTCTTLGRVSITSDSIMFFPQQKRNYPSRSYLPSVESRGWVDDGKKEWVPDSDGITKRLSIKEFYSTYKKY